MVEWGEAAPRHGAAPRSDGTALDYIDVEGGQLAIRRHGIGKGRPLVILPPAPGSASQLGALPEALAADREVVAIDLPGCGDSDVLVGVSVDVEAYADQLALAIGILFRVPVDLYARDGACAVAIALRKRHPETLRGVLLDNPPAIRPDERDEIASRYAEPITLDWDGAHLIRLWHATRDQELYWPWYERTRDAVRYENDPEIDPNLLTGEVHAYLKNHATYAETWKAVLSYPIFEALQEKRCGMVISGDTDGRFFKLARSSVSGQFMELPRGTFARSRKVIEALKCAISDHATNA